MPDAETLERALELVGKGPAQYDYFFDNLDDPSWIEPLLERGFFTSPTPPVVSGEGSMHPYWSESQFLLRMVERDPRSVAAAVAAIPSTENVRVVTDICRIGASLPAPMRLAVAKQVCKETKGRPLFFLLPEAMSELIVAVAAAGEPKFALHFSAELLALHTPQTEGSLPPKPIGRVDAYEYERLVGALIPELVPWSGLEAMELAADLLAETIEQGDRREAPRDFSEYWRPAIEDDSENHGDDVTDGLVAAVRDSALALIDENRADLAEVVDRLRARGWHLFTRIALYVAAERASADAAFAQELAMESTLLEEGPLDRERDRLVAAVFGDLDDARREAYLAKLEMTSTKPPSEDAERDRQRLELWQRDRLAPLAGHLPDHWTKRLEQLTERYGEPQPDRFRVSAAYWSGPTSPITEPEMAGMPAAAVIDLVANWTPEQEIRSPTPEGLARVLSDRVKASPLEFGTLVERIIDLDPTYVRAVLDGLETAARQGEDMPWPDALTLVEVAVSSPPLDETPEQRERDDRDPDWRWARKEAASLIETVLQNDLLPSELSERAWESLQKLSWDKEPDAEYERRFGGSNMDPLTLSLNTTRGEAMHGVVAFAVWARQCEDEESLQKALGNLDEHLDPRAEPSVTIRGVFGARLHQLHSIAPDWLAERITALFPPEADLRAQRLAAWDTYLIWGRPSSGLFEILEPQYRAAIEELPIGEDRKAEARKDPGDALAEHLATFLWWGTLDTTSDGLAERYFEAAEPDQAAHLLEVLGRSLAEEANQPASPVVLSRLEDLWTAIPGWIAGRAPEERSVILAGFGELYASGVFEETWADRELLRLAGEGIVAGAEYVVFDRLVARAPSAPQTALRFALLFVEKPPKPWSIDAHRKDLRAIVEAGLESDERELAVQLVNQLTAKGHRNFRDLLQGSEE